MIDAAVRAKPEAAYDYAELFGGRQKSRRQEHLNGNSRCMPGHQLAGRCRASQSARVSSYTT
jgi:hypothetical protein